MHTTQTQHASVLAGTSLFLIVASGLPSEPALAANPEVATVHRFDEINDPPASVSTATLVASIDEHLRKYRGLRRDELLSDDDYRRWTEIWWQLGDAIDRGQPMEPLAPYGVTVEPNGSVSLDVENFQFWDPLESRIVSFFETDRLNWSINHLIEQGFASQSTCGLRPRDGRVDGCACSPRAGGVGRKKVRA